MKTKQLMPYSLIKPYMLIGILALFYFAVGLQDTIWRGVYIGIVFTSVQLIVYYGNQVMFIPRYFENNKKKYYMWNAISILVVVLLFEISDFIMVPLLSAHTKRPSLIFPFFIYSMLSIAAWWISISKYLMDKEKITSVEIEGLKREKLESELKYLKTQINPHFFFNAMNNIYSMAYIGDKSVPEKIAMLSDMMRYVLYECESDYIPLNREIDYINNYVEFQQLKTEGEQNIHFICDNHDGNYLIAPMLLIPFVENGFKHSKIAKDKNAFVEIVIKQDEEMFSFSVTNNYSEVAPNPNCKGKSGIGIDNVRNRLHLIYPERHKLDISKNNGKHTIYLELYKHEQGKKI